MQRLPRPTFALTLAFVLTTGSSVACATPFTPPVKPAPPVPTAPPPTKAEIDRQAILLRLPKPNPAGFIGDPYPLETCMVTGAPLGPDAVTLVLKDQLDPLQEGRQLKFASKEAEADFIKSPRGYLQRLDAEIIARFEASYPLDRDVVEIDRKLTERFPFVYGNRCYVVMRRQNIDNFLKQAGRYVASYDKMVGGMQRAKYPLDTSLVTGEKLPEKPYDLVIGGRLIRLGSEAEAATVLEKPKEFLAKLPPLKGTSTSGGQAGTSENARP